MQIFEIAPAGMRPLWLYVPIIVAFLAGLFVIAVSTLGMKTARFELSNDGLRLRGDLYGRLIPADQLRGGSARRLDLGSAGELRPAIRTLGTGLPGYRAGWFRLKNGEKALLYITDPTRVVYIPTRSGYALLLSVQEPDAFLTALRAVAPAG
jgi:hypothetical protein